MERQRVLAREDRPRLWAVLDEAAIRRAVGRWLSIQNVGISTEYNRLPPKDDSYRSPAWEPKLPVDLPPFLYSGGSLSFEPLTWPDTRDRRVELGGLERLPG